MEIENFIVINLIATVFGAMLGIFIGNFVSSEFGSSSRKALLERTVEQIEQFGKPMSPMSKMLVEDTTKYRKIIHYIDEQIKGDNQ